MKCFKMINLNVLFPKTLNADTFVDKSHTLKVRKLYPKGNQFSNKA